MVITNITTKFLEIESVTKVATTALVTSFTTELPVMHHVLVMRSGGREVSLINTLNSTRKTIAFTTRPIVYYKEYERVLMAVLAWYKWFEISDLSLKEHLEYTFTEMDI